MAGRVAVVGSYGVGMTMRLPRVPAEGETIVGSDLAMGPGGKGSNQAIGAARLGLEVDLMTAVGRDTFADEALRLWAAESVGHAQVKRSSSATMAGFILVEPDGANRICIAPGALDDFAPSDVTGFSDRIEVADLLVTGLEIPVDTAVEALRVGRARGVRTLLDPAPAQPLPDDAWALIDHLTPNRGEAATLIGAAPDASPETLADGLRSRTDATIALTLGGDGVLVDDGQSRVHVPAVRPRQVVDTTGAGDAFTAAYSVALVEGASAQEAARFGAAAGAHAVTIAEVVPSLARRADIEALGGGPKEAR